MPRKTQIVSAFAGCGKTEMAKRHPDLAVDIESSDYRWRWPEVLQSVDPDSRKGISGTREGELRWPNPEWPGNYIDRICAEYDRGKWEYVLISMHQEVVEHLILNRHIPIIRVYPPYEDKNDYLRRYRARGNAEPFVTFMELMFNITVRAAEAKRNESYNRMGEVVFLSSGEFLEDALLRMRGGA